MKRWPKIVSISLMMLFSSQHYASASDQLIEGAKLCTKHLPRYEREYAIPTHLLSAIASTESGRYHEGLKLKLPWPWTINVGGKGYFYPSKDEAIAAVKKLRAHGIEKIDVGCMQVNLYHHSDAFASLDQAFEPESNIAYAAGFLRSLYNDSGTWKKAAADYHSKTPSLGKEYVDTVYDSWFNIIEKLRAARLRVPQSAVVGMNDMKNSDLSPSAGKPVTAPAAQQMPSQPVAEADTGVKVKTTPLPEQEGRKVPAYVRPHMNNIQVVSNSDTVQTTNTTQTIIENRKEKTVMVVKPEILTADSSPLQSPVPSSMAAAAVTQLSETTDGKLTPVNNTPAIISPVPQNRKAGPSFIFND